MQPNRPVTIPKDAGFVTANEISYQWQPRWQWKKRSVHEAVPRCKTPHNKNRALPALSHTHLQARLEWYFGCRLAETGGYLVFGELLETPVLH